MRWCFYIALAAVVSLPAAPAVASAVSPAVALDLAALCPAGTVVDTATPVTELRSRVEVLMTSDPTATVALLCGTIPRVAREYGDDSLEYAWWVGSLATPLIAFQNKLSESLPLLDTARPLLERHLGVNAVELADIHVAYAWIYFRQGRLGEAGEAWEHALRIREMTPGEKKVELQKALVGLAQVRLAQREFVSARAALDRAYAILKENGETQSEAAAAIENAYANLSIREEDYAGARRHAEAQIEIEKALAANVMQLVPAYVVLGRALERLNEFEASEAALMDAIRLAEHEEGPLQRHYLAALTELGVMLNERDEVVRALPVATRAVEVGTATLGVHAPRMVRVLQNLGEVHRSLGDLSEAVRLYELAGKIVAADPSNVERPSLVAYFRGRGDLEWSLGEVSGARTALEQGLAAAGTEITLNVERAEVLLSLAQTWARADSSAARGYLEEALGLFAARLPDTHPTILRVVNELCGIEVRTTPRNAPLCDDAADRIARSQATGPSLLNAVFENQSKRAERTGDRPAARTYSVLALASAETLGTPDPLWTSYYHLARLLAADGDRVLAIFFGKLAVSQIEKQRLRFVGDYRRFDRGFLQPKVEVYRVLADWLMEDGRIEEGLAVLQLLKTEELYDFVVRSAETTSPGDRVALTGSEQRLFEAYSATLHADTSDGETLERLGRLAETERLSIGERLQLSAMLAARRGAEQSRAKRIQAMLEASRGSAPRADTGQRNVIATSLDHEVRRYGADTAVAIYLLTDTHLRLLIATSTGQQEHRLEVDGVALRRDIGRYLERVTRREEVLAESRTLYETLLRPVDEAASRAGAQRLVLWLDGALRYLPIGALESAEGPLIDRYTILVHADAAGSESDVVHDQLRVRGFGVTRALAGYAALPAVADEICYLVRGPISGLVTSSAACTSSTRGYGVIDGEAFTNEAFTEDRLVTTLSQPADVSVLHLGTHFSLRPGNALRSFLVLGDGGRLTLERINALDFRGIELVTLSACQTALGGATTDDGRELEALSALVQRRGARRVVASLWQVEDRSTALLMRKMYQTFVETRRDAAGALRKAQLTIRSQPQYAHPYYWAGFVASGSG